MKTTGIIKEKRINKYTHEIFVDRLKQKHSEKYTFEHVNYTGSNEKIIVTCKKHGPFTTYASAFMNSETFNGCLKCREERRRKEEEKRKKGSSEDKSALANFIRLCKKNNFDKYDYSETVYTGSEETVIIVCPAHGEIEVDAVKHKQGKEPCPVCKSNRAKHGKLYADREFERLAKENALNKKSS